MSMPLFQPAFPPTEFDLFLEEIGLASLISDEEKENLIAKARSIVSYKVVNLISLQINSEEKQAEMIRLMEEGEKNDDYAPINNFLLQEIPDWELLVEEAINEVKDEMRLAFAKMPDAISRGLQLLGRSGDYPAQPTPAPTAPTTLEPLPNTADTYSDPFTPSAPLPPQPSSLPYEPVANNPAQSTDDHDSQQAIDDELQAIRQHMNP